MKRAPLLSFLEDEIFLKLVEEVLMAGFAAVKKSEEKFNSNVIDPFSMLFEAGSFGLDGHSWMALEKARQSQKTLSNKIGLFHQKLIGQLDGWIDMEQQAMIDVVNNNKCILAEIKNKYNTIKASDRIRLYENLRNMVMLKTGKYRNYTAYYVEIIPRKPERYDIPFVPSDNSTSSRAPKNQLIRQIDGASFYDLATGESGALTQIHDALPRAIDICLQRKDGTVLKMDRSFFRDYFFKAFGRC